RGRSRRSRCRSPSATTSAWRPRLRARRGGCSGRTASSPNIRRCATSRTSSRSTRTRGRTTSTRSSWGRRLRGSVRSTECGVRSAECGIEVESRSPPDAPPDIPHSAFHIPHLLAGAVTLALLPLPAGAQQPDSLPTDTLSPVVVTGVRLPTARELARGLAGRTATLHAADVDARGVRSLADALEQLLGV